MKRLKDMILGMVLGMLLVGVPVMAVSYIPSKDVSYKTDYNENVTNVEEALDILTNQVNVLNNTGDSVANDILSGKTAYVNGKLLTGSMANYSGSTKTASNITESGNNALITIPGGYYDDESIVSVPIDNISQLPTISSMYDDIYNAIVAAGATPASKNLADIVTAISAVKTNNYNSGYNNGHSIGYNSGYSNGYNAGTNITKNLRIEYTSNQEGIMYPFNVYVNNALVHSGSVYVTADGNVRTIFNGNV